MAQCMIYGYRDQQQRNVRGPERIAVVRAFIVKKNLCRCFENLQALLRRGVYNQSRPFEEILCTKQYALRIVDNGCKNDDC